MKKILIAQFRTGFLEKNEQEAFKRALGIDANRLIFYSVLQQREYPPLEALSGIIVAGSGDNSMTENHDWYEGLSAYLRTALERGIPFFGICFGHQLLGKMLRSNVVADPAQRELGTITVTLTDEGINDPLFAGLPQSFLTIAGHNDSVATLPADTTMLATNKTCKLQAFKMNGAPAYAVQFHPELTEQDYKTRLNHYRSYYEHHGSNFEELLERGTTPTNCGQILKNFVSIMAAAA